MDQTTASDSWADPERHPLDDDRTRVTPAVGDADGADTATPVRRGRGLGSNRHLFSTVIAFLAVPAAYFFIDYGYNRAMATIQSSTSVTELPQKVMIALAAAAGLMLLAALMGRVSAVGPLIAGLVWGVGPLVWVLLDFGSFVDRLNDIPEMYDNTGFGLYSAGFAVFPATAGLLIGTAIAGRWRRHHPAPAA